MIEAEFVFQLPVILLDPPAALGEAHEPPQPEGLTAEIRQPVLGGCGRFPRPLHETQFLARGKGPPRW